MGDQFVLLAAGSGTRMGESACRCKTLISLLGDTLLEHHLKSISRYLPTIEEVLVVVGTYTNRIKAFIRTIRSEYEMDITVIDNPAVHRENGYSLLQAEPYISGYPFYFAMVDHFADPALYLFIPSGPSDTLVACIDTNRKSHFIGSGLKLQLDPKDSILDIGDHLDSWDATDTGFFQGTKETFAYLSGLEQTQSAVTVEDMVRVHIKARTAKTIDITGRFWVNINTVDDLLHAKQILLEEYPHLFLHHAFLTEQPHPGLSVGKSEGDLDA